MSPDPISEDKLIGSGVWFHASNGDELALVVYAQLWQTQPTRLDLVAAPPQEAWIFWVKDNWPTPIQANAVKFNYKTGNIR